MHYYTGGGRGQTRQIAEGVTPAAAFAAWFLIGNAVYSRTRGGLSVSVAWDYVGNLRQLRGHLESRTIYSLFCAQGRRYSLC